MRGVLLVCAVVYTALTAGCTSTSWPGRKSSSPALADKASGAAAAETAAAEKKSSPFVSERDRSAKSAETNTAAKEPPAAQPTAKPNDAAGKLALSADTLKLIDEELKDATPEERAQWYEQLKRVEPGVIPEILRARRMSLQVASKATTEDADPTWSHPGSATSAERVQPAAHVMTATAPAVTPADFQTPAGTQPKVDQAIHTAKPESSPNGSGVQLQGFEAETPIATGTPMNPQPIAIQRPPGNDPSGFTFSEPAAPAVPWPPQKTPPSAPSKSSLAPPLAFGAGLVQNVVGLVPSRNSNPLPPAPSQPAAQPTTESGWQTELAQAIALLEQELATPKTGPLAEDDLRRHVALRLLYLLSDHQERALTAIPGLDPAEQEFWQQVIWGLSNSLDTRHIPRAEDRATQTISQLSTAIRRLQEKADLQVRNVAFSKQNFGYGNYDRFVQNEVRPGQEVLLYAEIENFKSEPTADGQYRTLLRSTIEILSPAGEVRKKIDFPATEDLCRNYRRDYFHNYQFTIPDRLPLGPHVLKLTVFDELSGKMASYTLNFLAN